MADLLEKGRLKLRLADMSATAFRLKCIFFICSNNMSRYIKWMETEK